MSNDKKHIAIICSRLDLPGGIERAIVNTANLFKDNGHEVTLIILDETKESFYPVHQHIKILQADLHFGLTTKGNLIGRKISFWQHIKVLRKLILASGANTVVASEYQFAITTRLIIKEKNIKIFSWEHHHFYWLKKSRFWKYLFKKIYPKLDGVICLNKTEKKYFEDIGCTTFVIPNFIKENKITSTLSSKNILTVGWLIKRKGVDLIPGIAEIIFRKHTEWKWKIIGDGEEFNELQHQIKNRQLENNLQIVSPTTPDLTYEYLDTSVYVMTSRFECFPMVLLEAMNFGVPCISFDCPTGPADIIKHNEDGVLIEPNNIKEMVAAIDKLIADEKNRIEMGKKAHLNIQRFSAAAVYQQWSKVINESK